ncbi:hypothetical protein DYB32_005689 [Aphanomyces invadans]|nr:hypothetical protein DYB32_005689 [Aphanomyces invadans]
MPVDALKPVPPDAQDSTSLGSLMAQSSSILTALMQAESLEASAKSEAVLRSVHDHANTLRLALEQLTAKIKAHHTGKQASAI